MNGYIFHADRTQPIEIKTYSRGHIILSNMYKYANRNEQTLLNTIMCDLHNHPRRTWCLDGSVVEAAETLVEMSK